MSILTNVGTNVHVTAGQRERYKRAVSKIFICDKGFSELNIFNFEQL